MGGVKEFIDGLRDHKEWRMGVSHSKMYSINDSRKYYKDRHNTAAYKGTFGGLTPREAFWSEFGQGMRPIRQYFVYGYKRYELGIPHLTCGSLTLNPNPDKVLEGAKKILGNNNIEILTSDFAPLMFLNMANLMDSNRWNLWKMYYIYILQEHYNYDPDKGTFLAYELRPNTVPYVEGWTIPDQQTSITVPVKAPLFATQASANGNGNFVSQGRGEATVYGPYKPMQKGMYRFIFEYTFYGIAPTTTDAEGNEVPSPIATMDLCHKFGQVFPGMTDYYRAKAYAGNTRVVLDDVLIPEGINDLEVRLFSSSSGITVTNLIIEKRKKTYGVDWDNTGLPIWQRSFYMDKDWHEDEFRDSRGQLIFLPRPLFGRIPDRDYVKDIPSLRIAEKIAPEDFGEDFTWQIKYPDGTQFRPPNTSMAEYITEGIQPPDDFATSYWFIEYKDKNTNKDKILVYKGSNLPTSKKEASSLDEANKFLMFSPFAPIIEDYVLVKDREGKHGPTSKLLKKLNSSLSAITDSIVKREYDKDKLDATSYYLYMAIYGFDNLTAEYAGALDFGAEDYPRSNLKIAIREYIQNATDEQRSQYMHNIKIGFQETREHILQSSKDANQAKIMLRNQYTDCAKDCAVDDVGCIERCAMNFLSDTKKQAYQDGYNCSTDNTSSYGIKCMANRLHDIYHPLALAEKNTCLASTRREGDSPKYVRRQCPNGLVQNEDYRVESSDDYDSSSVSVVYYGDCSVLVDECNTTYDRKENYYKDCITNCGTDAKCIMACAVEYFVPYEATKENPIVKLWDKRYNRVERIHHWETYSNYMSNTKKTVRDNLLRYINHVNSTLTYDVAADDKLGSMYLNLGVDLFQTEFQHDWDYRVPRKTHPFMTADEKQQVRDNNAKAGDENASLLLFYTLLGLFYSTDNNPDKPIKPKISLDNLIKSCTGLGGLNAGINYGIVDGSLQVEASMGGKSRVKHTYTTAFNINYRTYIGSVSIGHNGIQSHDGVVDQVGHAHHKSWQHEAKDWNLKIKMVWPKVWKSYIKITYWVEFWKDIVLYYQDTPTTYKTIFIARLDSYNRSRLKGLDCKYSTVQRHELSIKIGLDPFTIANPVGDFIAWYSVVKEGYQTVQVLLPISYGAINTFSMPMQMRLYPTTIYLSTMGYDYTMVYWYQSDAFKLIITIVMVVITVVGSIFSAGAAAPGLIYLCVQTLIIMYIVGQVLQAISFILTLLPWASWIKAAVMVIVTVIAIAITGDISKAFDGVMATGFTVLSLATTYVTSYMGFEAQKQAKEFKDVSEKYEKRQEEMQQAEDFMNTGLDTGTTIDLVSTKNALEDTVDAMKSSVESTIQLISNETRMYMTREAMYNYDMMYSLADSSVSSFHASKYMLIS